MNEKQLISIIIPCYNDADYVEQAVQSALEQTYSNKEIIVVNDGSDAKTKVVLKKLEPKINKLISQANLGLSAARNNGIKASNGRLILVLDSDDFFERSFCEKAEQIYRKNYPKYKIITCQAIRFNHQGNIDVFTPEGGALRNFLFCNSAIGNSLFSKEDWKEINGYDEKMKRGYEDWEFFIRLLHKGGSAYVIKEPLFNYRQKEISMRKNANTIKYDLWKYIYLKHAGLYKEHYEFLIKHLLNQIQIEEKTKLEREKSIDYRIGKTLLFPVRKIKKFFKHE